MARTQNATFCGDEPDSIGERVRGGSIAQKIAAGLAERKWSPNEIDDWRDAGFLIPVARDGACLDVVLLQFHGDERRWILQVAAARYPGVLRRWFGAVPSAISDEVYALASEIHAILSECGFTDFQWCWDEFADGEHCTREPSAPAQTMKAWES